MQKKLLRAMQIFTVIYFATMFFIGSVARIAWNYNVYMTREEWPSEIEEAAWSLELDEFLLVRDAWVYVGGEAVRQVEFSRWTDEEVAQWMLRDDVAGVEGWRLWPDSDSQAGDFLVVYSDMRVEYEQSLIEKDSRMVLYYLGQGTPSKLEVYAGRLDYVDRSIPYRLLGETGLWLADKVPMAIMLATLVWTVLDMTLSSSIAGLEYRRRK